MPNIVLAQSDNDLTGTASLLAHCFPVMHELRPHLDEPSLLPQVKRQIESQGYRIAFVEDNGEVAAVAGFCVVEMLAWGGTMYVDDLVTAETKRSTGYGGTLFDWLVEQARTLGCDQFHLDSGVQRYGAHRFYLPRGLDITSHHFEMTLGT